LKLHIIKIVINLQLVNIKY